MTAKQYIDKNLEKTIRNNTQDIGSLLGLPYPYTVPCVNDTFLEMYYWDTYFTNLGLIKSGNLNLAKNNVDNMLYLVEKYGFVPNGNRTYYLNRSQPPFLYMAVRDVFLQTRDKKWLSDAYKTLCKEYEFWQNYRCADNGLNFYGNQNVPADKVKWLYNDFTKRSGGYVTDNEKEKIKIAHTVRTFVESGWDCNSRFEFDGEFYNPVDLNSLLYGFENQMIEFSRILCIGDESLWKNRSDDRKEKMMKYMWNSEKKIFMDWNFKEKRFSPVVSAASIYPLFAGMTFDFANTIKLIDDLLLPFGVSASLKANTKGYQWDYPNVWPPVQYIAYMAAMNAQEIDLATEIKQKYINLIDSSFAATNALWEKYDGNTGLVAHQDYDAPEMLGWTAGVYLYFIEVKKGGK